VCVCVCVCVCLCVCLCVCMCVCVCVCVCDRHYCSWKVLCVQSFEPNFSPLPTLYCQFSLTPTVKDVNSLN
jgi:hypothetical protein